MWAFFFFLVDSVGGYGCDDAVGDDDRVLVILVLMMILMMMYVLYVLHAVWSEVGKEAYDLLLVKISTERKFKVTGGILKGNKKKKMGFASCTAVSVVL